MPGFSRTGPQGDGPMTGRRMGYCADNENQSGNSFGRGGRFGMGRRGNFDPNVIDSSEKSSLESEINKLKDQLSSLVKEVTGLKNKSGE